MCVYGETNRKPKEVIYKSIQFRYVCRKALNKGFFYEPKGIYMARPFIEGLKYFPLNVDIFEDAKMIDMNLDFGIIGEMVYLRLLTLIYKQGYYLEMSVDLAAKTLIRSIGNAWTPNLSDMKKIILKAADIGLFDKDLLEQDIITSFGIQKQFVLATRRRRFQFDRKYWLLDDKTMFELSSFYKSLSNSYGNNNPCNGDNNNSSCEDIVTKTGVSVYKSTQKEKEKKKEIKRDKKDKEDKGVFHPPKYHFLTQGLVQNLYLKEESLEIGKYNKLFEEALKIYGYDDVLTATDYIVSYSKRSEIQIEDKFAFLRKALLNNLEMFIKRREQSHESIEDWFKRLVL